MSEPTAPHEVLDKLRDQSGTEQMAVFAEALIMECHNATFSRLDVIAAAYMLGRCDAGKRDEPAGSAPKMAEAVLRATGVLQEEVAF